MGLPRQWASLVGDTPANQSPGRPKALIDPLTTTRTVNDNLDRSYVSQN